MSLLGSYKMTNKNLVYLVNAGNDPGMSAIANDYSFPALGVLSLGTWLKQKVPGLEVRVRDGGVHSQEKILEDIQRENVYNELIKADIKKPIIFIGNKIDSPSAKKNAKKLKKKFKDLILLSTLKGMGMEDLKKEIWEKSNLIRVYTENEKEPMILEKGSSVKDLIEKIHKDLLVDFKEALINGKSAKFPNQKTGLSHILEDEDRVKITS